MFNGIDTAVGRMVPVECWDVAGTALVVDPMSGALHAVTAYVEQADQVVAAVPGGGWKVH